MENASKALIIAGAILISILIIAIGMYIYSSSTNSIRSGINSMDTQEKEAFNSQWTNYEGKQSGAQVKSLITKLIANANTNKDEEHKVVNLTYPTNGTGTATTPLTYNGVSDSVGDFMDELNDAYTAIKANHTYTVTFDYESTELIRRIIVTY
ncbi:MAG: hypothetical protein ACI4UE_05415 [Candidatus Scatovivens sp.]